MINNHLKSKLVPKVEIILLKRVAGSEELQMMMVSTFVDDNHDYHRDHDHDNDDDNVDADNDENLEDI